MAHDTEALSPRPGSLGLPDAEALARRVADRLIAGIVEAAPARGTAGGRLDRLLALPWHSVVAFSLFASALLRSIEAETARGHPAAWLAIVAIPAALLLLRRPVALALVMTAAGIYLRALYLGSPETCDQIAVSRAAFGVALTGRTPYGFGYAESWPAGSPYPYSPLAMPVSVLGVPGEVLAVSAMMLILSFGRALLTVAVLSAWVISIEFGICGLNDQVPALLLLAGLLLVERGRMLSGGALVALSAAIKPYTLAWFPPLIGLGGASMGAILVGVSAIAWLPVLAWGPASFLRSIELARLTHPEPANTLNLPWLRVIAVPLAAASLLVRSWTVAVLMGALIFCAMMFLDYWASIGYWFVVGPLVGLVVDRALVRFGADLRGARLAQRAPMATASA